ncbi:MAG: alpha/beta hydrolase [Planctomycetaceae bacterium]|nr:alpha/beta hydrolase [Planctomycetaceae bacterium]
MRLIPLIALSFVVCCLIASPCSATCQNAKEPAAAAAEEVKPPIVTLPDSVLMKDVAYITDGDPLQKMDIYAPKEAKNAPVVVFIHGGGWNKRDKDEVSSQPKLFNAAGIIVVSINYRLVPAVTHPENVRDVAAAVAWISKNISKHGGDPGQIFVMGHSAGSHLAALVATDDRYLAAHGLHRNQLAGVITLDGSAFDIPDRVRNGSETIAENCRRAFGTDEKVQQDGSPVTHVRGETSLPPFLMVYLKTDSLNHKQTQRFAELVQAAAGKARVVHITEEKTHQSLCDDLGTDHDTTGPMLIEFIRSGAR